MEHERLHAQVHAEDEGAGRRDRLTRVRRHNWGWACETGRQILGDQGVKGPREHLWRLRKAPRKAKRSQQISQLSQKISVDSTQYRQAFPYQARITLQESEFSIERNCTCLKLRGIWSHWVWATGGRLKEDRLEIGRKQILSGWDYWSEGRVKRV